MDDFVPVMVQRWCPSSLEVMPVREINLKINEPDPTRALKAIIAQHVMLPFERIEISEVNELKFKSLNCEVL